MEHAESGAAAVAEAMQVFLIVRTVREMNIHTGWRLVRGVVVPLMNREREYAGVLCEDCCRAVAVVHVAIHHHCATDESVLLQAADRDGDIVDRAEALPVIGERVMKAA